MIRIYTEVDRLTRLTVSGRELRILVSACDLAQRWRYRPFLLLWDTPIVFFIADLFLHLRSEGVIAEIHLTF